MIRIHDGSGVIVARPCGVDVAAELDDEALFEFDRREFRRARAVALMAALLDEDNLAGFGFADGDDGFLRSAGILGDEGGESGKGEDRGKGKGQARGHLTNRSGFAGSGKCGSHRISCAMARGSGGLKGLTLS